MPEVFSPLSDPLWMCLEYRVRRVYDSGCGQCVWSIFYASRCWRNSNPLVYLTITGTIGSFSVMGCQGLGVGIDQTFVGTTFLTDPVILIILATVLRLLPFR